jgi:hypothetical protein
LLKFVTRVAEERRIDMGKGVNTDGQLSVQQYALLAVLPGLLHPL